MTSCLSVFLLSFREFQDGYQSVGIKVDRFIHSQFFDQLTLQIAEQICSRTTRHSLRSTKQQTSTKTAQKTTRFIHIRWETREVNCQRMRKRWLDRKDKLSCMQVQIERDERSITESATSATSPSTPMHMCSSVDFVSNLPWTVWRSSLTQHRNQFHFYSQMTHKICTRSWFWGCGIIASSSIFQTFLFSNPRLLKHVMNVLKQECSNCGVRWNKQWERKWGSTCTWRDWQHWAKSTVSFQFEWFHSSHSHLHTPVRQWRVSIYSRLHKIM
jgi:hypothetical protein